MELPAEKTRSFLPHVLLAEDDDLTLRVVEQLLKQCKYKGALQLLTRSVLRAEVWVATCCWLIGAVAASATRVPHR